MVIDEDFFFFPPYLLSNLTASESLVKIHDVVLWCFRKKDERLDWMYQGPGGQIDRDEYLLGRPIDKQITQQYEEPESGPSAETGLLPGSIFNSNINISSMDMASKIREDPLFMIR